MFGINDFETPDGRAALEKFTVSLRRYIASRSIPRDEVEELVQNTILRVFELLNADPTRRIAHEGYFLRTARFIIYEYRNDKMREVNVFDGGPPAGEDDAPEIPMDAAPQLAGHREMIERRRQADCLLNCFQALNEAQQKLLWRYCFDDELALDAREPENYGRFFNTLLDTLRDAREWFLKFQQDPGEAVDKSSEAVRSQVHRARKRMKVCYKECLAAKKMQSA